MSSQKYFKFENYMDSGIMISAEELELLSNSHLFILKADLLKKLSSLLAGLSNELRKELMLFENNIPVEVLLSQPKISRGENYKGFPWMVLDFPRIFRQEDVFAFRNMCWWGNEFSLTLHLGGKYFEQLKPHLHKFLNSINIPGIYICVHESPWNYYFEKENYVLLSDFIEQDKDLIEWSHNRNFIKISKKTSLKNYLNLSKESCDFLRLLLTEMIKIT